MSRTPQKLNNTTFRLRESRPREETPRQQAPRTATPITVASFLVTVNVSPVDPAGWNRDSNPASIYEAGRGETRSAFALPRRRAASSTSPEPPSVQPSPRPSRAPSVQPSPAPSRAPSAKPSPAPSRAPSAKPSPAPSAKPSPRPAASRASTPAKAVPVPRAPTPVKAPSVPRVPTPKTAKLPLKRTQWTSFGKTLTVDRAVLKKLASGKSRRDGDVIVFPEGKRFSQQFIEEVVDLYTQIEDFGMRTAILKLLQRRDTVYWADHILRNPQTDKDVIFALFGNNLHEVCWDHLTVLGRGSFLHADALDLLVAVIMGMADQDVHVPVMSNMATQHVRGVRTVDGRTCMVASVEFYFGAVGMPTEHRRAVLPIKAGDEVENEIIVPFQLSQVKPRHKTFENGTGFNHFAYMSVDLQTSTIRIRDSANSRKYADSHRCAAQLVSTELDNYLQTDKTYTVVYEDCPVQVNNNCGFHVVLNIANRLMGISNSTEDCEQLRRVSPLIIMALGFEANPDLFLSA